MSDIFVPIGRMTGRTFAYDHLLYYKGMHTDCNMGGLIANGDEGVPDQIWQQGWPGYSKHWGHPQSLKCVPHRGSMIASSISAFIHMTHS